MKQIRIILLVLLIPYVLWILGQDRYHPRSHFAFLVLLSTMVPVACARLIEGRVRSTVAALVVTVIVLCLAMYIPAKITGNVEFLAWFPIVAAWSIAITAPVWIAISVVFGGMKGKKQGEPAEPAPPPYSSPATGSESGEA